MPIGPGHEQVIAYVRDSLVKNIIDGANKGLDNKVRHRIAQDSHGSSTLLSTSLRVPGERQVPKTKHPDASFVFHIVDTPSENPYETTPPIGSPNLPMETIVEVAVTERRGHAMDKAVLQVESPIASQTASSNDELPSDNDEDLFSPETPQGTEQNFRLQLKGNNFIRAAVIIDIETKSQMATLIIIAAESGWISSENSKVVKLVDKGRIPTNLGKLEIFLETFISSQRLDEFKKLAGNVPKTFFWDLCPLAEKILDRLVHGTWSVPKVIPMVPPPSWPLVESNDEAMRKLKQAWHQVP